MTSILATGKDGYKPDAEFDARTRAALDRLPSEWGDPEKLYERDAVEVLEFIQGDYQHVAPVLAGLTRYRLLDLGCGYGRLTPLLTAFRCVCYLGVEQCCRRYTYAWSHYARRGGPRRDIAFLYGDALDLIATSPWPGVYRKDFTVVWTSNVLQHLLLPDKKRLVKTMKACRAPGGICLLREEEIQPMSLAWCEKRYADARQPKHMVPTPEDLVRSWFAPLEFRRVGGNVWIAREPGSKIGG